MALRTKTALITGGSKRIGKAIVSDLVANGFGVVFHYADDDDCAQRLVEELGGEIYALKADLRDGDAARSLFKEAQQLLGPISLLVNNASIFKPDSAKAFDEELFDDHFAIHVKTPAILSECMASQENLEHGLVVNMIDQRVLRPNPRFFSYTLSKSALWTATQTMAQQFAPRIRVNAIGPGPTLANERQNADDFQQQIDALPLEKGPGLEEFGVTIRYLYDTPSITGQMIALDGGQHLIWQTPDTIGQE
ncbi:MAG: short chain dehydrogenase [Hyphomicrobiales bacterium]|nr:MAG: short chain dehydrogenase [Hyphomicrobiales bacterium]